MLGESFQIDHSNTGMGYCEEQRLGLREEHAVARLVCGQPAAVMFEQAGGEVCEYQDIRRQCRGQLRECAGAGVDHRAIAVREIDCATDQAVQKSAGARLFRTVKGRRDIAGSQVGEDSLGVYIGDRSREAPPCIRGRDPDAAGSR